MGEEYTQKDKLKISIITVSLNRGSVLAETIESVIKQTYTNIEYIIVDGESQDETVSIIKKYDNDYPNRIKWISEKDDGIYDAMNKGIAMATGDIIAILNSDDLLADNYVIENVVNIFNSNSSIDCVYADLYYVAQHNISKIVRHWKTGKKRSFAYGWHPAHPTFYVRKSIYDKYGSFDLRYKLSADFELMLRFIEKYKINSYYLPKVLVKMRLGGVSNQNLSNIKQSNLECMDALRNNGIPITFLYPLFRLLPKLKQFIHFKNI